MRMKFNKLFMFLLMIIFSLNIVSATQIFENAPSDSTGYSDIGNNAGTRWAYTTFDASDTYTIESFALKLDRTGGPTTYTVEAYLYDTVGDIPITLLSTTSEVYSTIAATPSLYNFTLDTNYSLIQGVRYALVVEAWCTVGCDGSNFIGIGLHSNTSHNYQKATSVGAFTDANNNVQVGHASYGTSSPDLIDSTVRYYQFENSGNVGEDSTGNQDGTNVGSTNTSSINSTFGSARSFDGTNDYVNLNDLVGLTTKSITWYGYIDSSGTFDGNTPFFSDIGGANATGSFLVTRVYDSGTRLIFSQNGQWVSGDLTRTDDIWKHYGITCDGTTIRIFIDGENIKNVTDSFCDLTSKSDEFRLALNEFDSAYSKIRMDEVAIFNRTLSQNEIKEIMTGGIPTPPPSAPTLTIDDINLINGTITNNNSLDITLNISQENSNTNINTTLFLSNGSSYQIGTNTQNVSYILNDIQEGTYNLWTYSFNNETNVTSSNYTYTFDLSAPIINLSFPTEINLNNLSINLSDYINIIDNTSTTCSINVTESGASTQELGNCSIATYIFTILGNASLVINATDAAGNTNTNSSIINIDLFRINMSFQSLFSGDPLDQVTVTETTLGTLGNSGVNTSLLVFLNPDNYLFTASKTNFVDTIVNFTKDNITVQQELIFNMSSIFNFTLIDERTLDLWNISATSSVIVQVVCTDESVIQQLVNTTNFTIDVPCSINKFKFIIDYTTDSYFRSILIDEDERDRNVYLIDLTTTQSVFNTFTIFDLSSDFINPRLSFRKNIPVVGEVEITGDVVDVQGLVPAYFILNDEYILQLTSDNQPTRNIGFYSADSPGDKVLKLFSLDFGISSTNLVGKVYMNSYIDNITLLATYNDTTLSASTATFTVYNTTKFGNIIFTSTQLNTDIGSFSYNIPTSQENTTLFTIISVTNDIDTFIKEDTHRQNNQIGLGLINFTIDLDWAITIFLGFIALILTTSTASVGALILLGLGALFSSFGWYGISWTVIALGMLLAIIKIAKESEVKT